VHLKNKPLHVQGFVFKFEPLFLDWLQGHAAFFWFEEVDGE
jgi:hypothetical protein